MGFDVSRAVAEALQSRLPFVDRLLSYLYFADASVLEQSTWDESGRGVTIVGRRGPAGPGGVLLAAPLPLQPSLPGLPRGAPDLVRGATLLAMTWALASLEDEELPEPVTLVAARPDPTGAALRSVVESGAATGRMALAGAPSSEAPRAVSAACASVSLRLDLPVRPLGAPLRDVVTWAHPAPGDGLAALHGLCLALDALSAVPLSLDPSPGVHLGPVDRLSVTVGLREPAPPPDGWVEEGRPTRVAGSGSCRPRLDALLDAARRLAEPAGTSWDRAGRSRPSSTVLLADLGASDPSGATLAVLLPPGTGTAGLAALDDALAAAPALDGRCRLAGDPGVGDSGGGDGAPVLAGTAGCLAGLVPRVLALGPAPGAGGDLAGAARDWGLRYRDALRDALPARRRTR